MVNSSGCVAQYLQPFPRRVGDETAMEVVKRPSQGTEPAQRKRRLSSSPQWNIGKSSLFSKKVAVNTLPCRERDWSVEIRSKKGHISQRSFLTSQPPLKTSPQPCILNGDQYVTLRGPPTPYGVTLALSPTKWQYPRSPSPSDLVIDEEAEPRVGAAAESEDCVTAGVPRGAQRPPSPPPCPAPAPPIDENPHRPRCQTFICSGASWLLSWPPPPPPLGTTAASSTPPPPPPPPAPPARKRDEESQSTSETLTLQSLLWPSPPPQVFTMAACGWDHGPWVVRGPRTPSIPPPPSFNGDPSSEATLTASPTAFDTPDSEDEEDNDDDEEEEEDEDEDDNIQYLPEGLKIGEGALLTGTKQYKVHRVLGTGVYGTVLRCEELTSGQSRAIKVLRLTENWGIAARNEARALGELSINKPDENSLLRLYETFVLDNFLILVTEHLQTDLSTFLVKRNGQPLRMDSTAYIVKQLLNALQMLEKLDIIHTDIKPDNVMLINHYVHPFRVKLIDFSNAAPASGDARRRPKYAQSRWYRAPEVVLRHEYSHPVDVWSVGCLAAEMACARPLFPARGEFQLLRAMCAILGPIPARVLFRGPRKVTEFFCAAHKSQYGFRLKTDEEYQADSGKKVTLPKWQFFDTFDDVFLNHMNLISADEKEEFTVEIAMFKDFLANILMFDQEQRITASKALEHPFIETVDLRSN